MGSNSNNNEGRGDFYDAPGDKTSAIYNYKKVLSTKEVPETRQKLEKLQAKKEYYLTWLSAVVTCFKKLNLIF